jgi:hypothetical protein
MIEKKQEAKSSTFNIACSNEHLRNSSAQYHVQLWLEYSFEQETLQRGVHNSLWSLSLSLSLSKPNLIYTYEP